MHLTAYYINASSFIFQVLYLRQKIIIDCIIINYKIGCLWKCLFSIQKRIFVQFAQKSNDQNPEKNLCAK